MQDLRGEWMLNNELFNITPVSQVVLDDELRIAAINMSACETLGVQGHSVIGKPYDCLDLIQMKGQIHTQKNKDVILKIDRRSFVYEDRPHELVSIFNITKYSEEMANLKKKNLNLQKYIDESNLIFLVLDTDANIRTINKKGRTVLEIHEDVVGINWIERFIPVEDQKKTKEVFDAVKFNQLTFDDYVEGTIQSATGKPCYIGWNNTTILCQGKVESILAVGFDLTDRRVKENELIFEATKDGMTKAFNRRAGLELFKDHFEKAREKGFDLSICFFDIDNLKEVNDTYGHFEGDRYIREIVAMIRWVMTDQDVIIRFGGDEFLVVFPGADVHQTKRLVERVLTHIAELNHKDFFRYSLSLSYGIASIKNYLSQDHLEMLAEADHQMYEMKKKVR